MWPNLCTLFLLWRSLTVSSFDHYHWFYAKWFNSGNSFFFVLLTLRLALIQNWLNKLAQLVAEALCHIKVAYINFPNGKHSKENRRSWHLLLKGVLLNFPLPTMPPPPPFPARQTPTDISSYWLHPLQSLSSFSERTSRILLSENRMLCIFVFIFVCIFVCMHVCVFFYESPTSFTWAWKCLCIIKFPAFKITCGALALLNICQMNEWLNK